MYFLREWRKYTGAESSKCAFRVATALWVGQRYVPLGVVASAQQGIPTHIDLLAEALGVGGEGAVEMVEEPFGGSGTGGAMTTPRRTGARWKSTISASDSTVVSSAASESWQRVACKRVESPTPGWACGSCLYLLSGGPSACRYANTPPARTSPQKVRDLGWWRDNSSVRPLEPNLVIVRKERTHGRLGRDGRRKVEGGRWEVGGGKWEVGSGRWEVGRGRGGCFTLLYCPFS